MASSLRLLQLQKLSLDKHTTPCPQSASWWLKILPRIAFQRAVDPSLPKTSSSTKGINFRSDRVSVQISCRSAAITSALSPFIPTRCFSKTSTTYGKLLDKRPGENRPPTPLRTKILSTLHLQPTRRYPHEKIWNIPNILTFSRLAAAPAVGYFILTSQPTLALSLFCYAGLTDLVDGFLARHLHQQTVVGTVIDPMADKALMTISVVALALQGGIPLALAALILARDLALAAAAVYIRWISLPEPKTMARYWDFTLPSAEVTPTEISKVNTFLQLLLVGAAMAMPVLPLGLVELWHLGAGFEVFQYVVAGTTVWSGASYVYSKNAFKILTREEIEARERKREEEEGKNGER